MTGDVLVLILLLGCFAFDALILHSVLVLKSRPVHSGRAELVRLACIQRDVAELLTLAHAAEVTLNGYDDRLADLQEARDDHNH